MKIVVFGASGRMGIKVVEQALEAGHIVTAFLRTSSKLDFIHLNINKKQGKLQQKLCQEVADAYPANGIYHDPGSL